MLEYWIFIHIHNNTVVRITAAVYEALNPILNGIREDIKSMKSDISMMMNGQVDYQSECCGVALIL